MSFFCRVLFALFARRLTLVFEYLDQDLKKYLDICEGGLEPTIIKFFPASSVAGLSLGLLNGETPVETRVGESVPTTARSIVSAR